MQIGHSLQQNRPNYHRDSAKAEKGIQPTVQINIEPLLRPLQQVQPVPPIVYSFGQTDFASKLFSQNTLKPATEKNISLDIEDDFADILGFVRSSNDKTLYRDLFFFRNKVKAPTEQIKENDINLSQYNLQDILEPLAKASAGTARTQYLRVARYTHIDQR